jgi:scyllo-inositol 2-dehydrogenase (NADP+)
MNGKIRIAVIGLGWVAQARHIPAIRRDPRYDLIGVIDRSDGRAAAAAQKFGIPHHAQADALSKVDWAHNLDAMSIATAPMAHHDLAIEALNRGLHVITEKPFAMSRSEGNAMVAAAHDAERHLAVVHNFQFARSMQRLLTDVAAGRFGTVTGIRAVQLGNPRRRLPVWYEDLPLGLFYDESPHLLYLLRALAGPLTLKKAVSVESRKGMHTPDQIDAWFAADSADYAITLSCNFESALSEWHIAVHGDKGVGIVDIFRDIYLCLPNDGGHGTKEVLRTSLSATWQHWWQHITSGIPHLTGKLIYGNDQVFGRFADAIAGDATRLAPISAAAARATLCLQHDIINTRERISA